MLGKTVYISTRDDTSQARLY